MCAQQVQPQRVIGIWDKSRGWSGENQILTAASCGVRTDLVQKLVPGHCDEPALRVFWWFARPMLDGFNERLLHGVFGGCEIGPTVNEDPQDLRDQVSQQGLIHPGFNP
jgi:hypothetical protein